jgi:hypothetical protein
LLKNDGGNHMSSQLMCSTRSAEGVRILDYSRWSAQLPRLAKQYRKAEPFPHIQLQDFLEPEVALACAQEFPTPNGSAWTIYKHYNENKVGLKRRELFPPMLGRVTDELNSPEFVRWICELTGFHDLVSDADLVAGGLQQSGPGGFLNVHADFTMHHYRTNWRRCVNVILYLNPGWRADWGGALELWDEGMTRCTNSVPPLLNRILIFNTTPTSYHGFPRKLTCPEGVVRKSLAVYYYSIERESSAACGFANFKPLPNQGRTERVLMGLDTAMVQAYSRMKRALGIEDDVASKILGFFARRK